MATVENTKAHSLRFAPIFLFGKTCFVTFFNGIPSSRYESWVISPSQYGYRSDQTYVRTKTFALYRNRLTDPRARLGTLGLGSSLMVRWIIARRIARLNVFAHHWPLVVRSRPLLSHADLHNVRLPRACLSEIGHHVSVFCIRSMIVHRHIRSSRNAEKSSFGMTWLTLLSQSQIHEAEWGYWAEHVTPRRHVGGILNSEREQKVQIITRKSDNSYAEVISLTLSYD